MEGKGQGGKEFAEYVVFRVNGRCEDSNWGTGNREKKEKMLGLDICISPAGDAIDLLREDDWRDGNEGERGVEELRSINGLALWVSLEDG